MDGKDDINERSLVHKLVLHGGVMPQDVPAENPVSDDITLLDAILKTSKDATLMLSSTDIFGRIPLHYAALNGYPKIAKLIVQHMEEAAMERRSKKIIGSTFGDHEGHSSLFYAVVHGFKDVVQVLTDVEGVNVDDLSIGIGSWNMLF